jgi:hypothetical protein
MPESIFDEVFASVDPLLGDVFDKDFVYRRDGRTIEIRASIRAHDSSADMTDSVGESWHSHNFELTAADLVLDGEVFEPAQDDEIAEANGDGTSTIYQVVRQPRRRCFEAIDSAGMKLLVFTNQIRRREQA